VQHFRQIVPLALLLVAVLALAGCGDSEETTVTETVGTETSSAPTTSTSSTETTSSESTGATDGAPPPADITVDESAAFETPSGNIGCFIDKLTVRCDIAERDWKPPAAPADCELDYGQGISLGAGSGAALVCAGDTVLGSGGETLSYGQAIAAGLLRCESAEDGLTCTDTENGSGFFLSQESYEIF
jgi:hypothetical protein